MVSRGIAQRPGCYTTHACSWILSPHSRRHPIVARGLLCIRLYLHLAEVTVDRPLAPLPRTKPLTAELAQPSFAAKWSHVVQADGYRKPSMRDRKRGGHWPSENAAFRGISEGVFSRDPYRLHDGRTGRGGSAPKSFHLQSKNLRDLNRLSALTICFERQNN